MKLFRLLCVVTIAGVLAGCAKNSNLMAGGSDGGAIMSGACSSNPYLQRYDCSVDRVEAAAENGDPDAQYALGYMYYYGLGTVRDIPTARLWIKRAASQDQPLAKKALRMIDSGGDLNVLHGGSRQHFGAGQISGPPKHYNADEVDQLNEKTGGSLHEVLPKYGTGRAGGDRESVRTKEAVAPPLSLRKLQDIPNHDPRLVKNSQPISPYENQSREEAKAPEHIASLKSESAKDLPSEASMTRVESELLHVPSDHFTLQVMAGHDLKALRDFVDLHQLQAETQFFHVTYEGRPWYVLVYGNYSSARKAHIAAMNLPKHLRQMAPWVKSMAAVHKEIRSGKVSA
ncbi:MAG: SEL1-like repeat protein [Gammaproteobacteria bacterium]|nr:SEL1-like repeat protein [Gammaproteobacteria bacterium]MCH9743406.1 SEL1-like repeat protein [Gammaproteobacteria bacterium]